MPGIGGPWDSKRGQPLLFGEDLLVANTDTDYITNLLWVKAWLKPSTGVWGQRMSSPPTPPPPLVCREGLKLASLDPFQSGYKNCLRVLLSYSLVVSWIEPQFPDQKNGDNYGTCLLGLWFGVK